MKWHARQPSTPRHSSTSNKVIKMKKIIITSAIAALLATTPSFAAIAIGDWTAHVQKDGTTIMVKFVGDEFSHYYINDDGTIVEQNADGDFVPQLIPDFNALFKEGIMRDYTNARRARTIGVPPSNKPGKKKQLVLLMQYPDKAFLNPDPQAYWHNSLNTGNIDDPLAIGSLHQYFLDQSNGIFDVEFDVRGPFTTKHNRMFYGKDIGSNDQHADSLIIEGCLALEGQVDFSDYDWDGDGEVEQVIAIYAGNGQNDSKSNDQAETIWPHQWAISQYSPRKPHVQDGFIIDSYCVINDEFRGNSDGIGTLAHEFSHCLGLPDLYSTGTQHGNDNLGTYDVMHSAYYNNQTWVPAAYSAYEKHFMGWLDYEELSEPATVSGLNSLANGGKAYIIRNDALSASADEYYLLENRRQEGWDTYIPGEGLIITHYDYSASAWNQNIVNNISTHQRVAIIPANNSSKITSGFPYPYTTKALDGTETISNDCLTDDSRPAASVFNTTSSGSKFMGKPVTNIRRDELGLISFDFMGGTAGIGDIMAESDPRDLEYFDAQGRKVSTPSHGSIYIIRNKKTNKTYKSSF